MKRIDCPAHWLMICHSSMRSCTSLFVAFRDLKMVTREEVTKRACWLLLATAHNKKERHDDISLAKSALLLANTATTAFVVYTGAAEIMRDGLGDGVFGFRIL